MLFVGDVTVRLSAVPKGRPRIAEDPNRPLIDRALAMGTPMTRVARRFGYPTATIASYRNRMPQQLKAAIVAAELKPKEADLDQLRIDESEGILGNSRPPTRPLVGLSGRKHGSRRLRSGRAVVQHHPQETSS